MPAKTPAKPSSKLLLLMLSLISVCTGHALAELKSIGNYQVEEHVTGLSYPWALAFISESHYLVTEKNGALRQVVDQVVGAPVTGLPDNLYSKGQGGLLDVILHPDYRTNKWLYLSYSSGNDDSNTLQVIRGRLNNNTLVDQETIFTVLPMRSTPVHYGARLAFMPDKTLLISSGDGFDYREDAQRLDNHMGKIIRVNDDGSLPADNPFAQHPGQRRFVYSYGHRNPQGLEVDTNRNIVVSHEHGPAGGDEINLIRGGNNYGWPVITNGKDYSGASISPFKQYPGMLQPFVDWTPSIAPSGLALYDGKMFPQMRGDMLISTLKSKEVRWVQMSGSQVQAQHSLFSELNQRIRDVIVHPDGSILLLTDAANGKVLRIVAGPSSISISGISKQSH